jgi:hypothetical protein
MYYFNIQIYKNIYIKLNASLLNFSFLKTCKLKFSKNALFMHNLKTSNEIVIYVKKVNLISK